MFNTKKILFFIIVSIFINFKLNASFVEEESFKNKFVESFLIAGNLTPKISQEEARIINEAGILFENNALDELEKFLKDFLERNKNGFPAIKYTYANTLFLKGDFLEAKKYYESTLKDFPSFARALRNLCFCLIELKDYKNAQIQISKALIYFGQDSSLWRALAFSRENNSDFAQAVFAYNQAISLEPENFSLIKSAAICAYKANELKMSLSLIDFLLRNKSKNEYNNDFNLWIYRAKINLENGENLEAACDLEMAKNFAKDDFPNWANSTLAGIYVNLKLFSKASEIYKQISDENSLEKALYAFYANKEIDLACEILEQNEALIDTNKLEKINTIKYVILSAKMRKEKNYEKAEFFIDKALQISPLSRPSIYEKIKILQALGKKQEMKIWLKRYE